MLDVFQERKAVSLRLVYTLLVDVYDVFIVFAFGQAARLRHYVCYKNSYRVSFTSA